jgi:prepilin-type N-terminal cleavage/methylation domain-containing protein
VRRAKQQGVTLVELLVVMVLMGILSALIVQYFTVQTRASEQQKALNEVSEATRVALTLITWDLQNAGYRVPVSSLNPGITAVSGNYKDTLTIRFWDDSLNTPAAQKVRYDIASTPTSLRRAKFAATQTDPGTGEVDPTVTGIVAMNVRYETRQDQYVMPTNNVCPANTTPLPVGATGAAITNCSVNWVFQDTPLRLVRQVKVQVLARSANRVPSYQSPVSSYSFDGTTRTYSAADGYVYQFAEQTVVTPNLGR